MQHALTPHYVSLKSLRFNFCVIVSNVARELLTLRDTELFESGQRRHLFHFLLNWCRGEAMLQDEQTRRQLNSHLGQTRDAEKRTAYEKVVRDQTFVLQHAACSAAASLLLGRCFDEDVVHPNGPVFAWVNSLLEQKERKKVPPTRFARNRQAPNNLSSRQLHSLARTALESFLQNSDQYPQLLDTAINQVRKQESASNT